MSIFKRYEDYYENRKLPQQEGDTRTAEDLAVFFSELVIIKRREEDGHVIEGEFKQVVLETQYEFMTKLGVPKGNNIEDKTVRTYEELVEFLDGESTETEDVEGTENEFVFEEEQQTTEEGDTSMGEFDFEFDTENSIGGDSGIPIVRRGSGEPINQTVNDEQEDSSNENGLEDFGLSFNFNEGEDDGVYETNPFEPEDNNQEMSEEELDQQFIAENYKMVSRFAYTGDEGEPNTDNNGNTEVNYSSCILFSFANGNRDEVFVAQSLEHAIQYVQSLGFIYNRRLNLFTRTGDSGHREYARVYLDLDLRGIVG